MTGGSGPISRIQRVTLGPRFSFLVKPIDIGLELSAIYSPHTSAPEFDRGEIARTHKCIDLRNRHVQVRRHIFQGQESRLDDRFGSAFFLGRGRAGHSGKIAPGADGYRHLTPFTAVWLGTRADQAA
jgi:hypothetical protein